ncbi:MAG TPA: phosphoglucosamine mutase [Thermoplasmatales archaeon]|nr:phosphoglucosamine mutase [Thermoplasmatales archaeon]
MTRLFGTNGVRGVVNEDMTGELALSLGGAIGTYFKNFKDRPRIAIGTDARLSNNMLKSACTSGLLSVGCDVVDLGILPTPTLQFAVKERDFDAGVIVTASHNPPQFNGIKVIDGDGTELAKEQEEKIEEIYFNNAMDKAPWNKVGNLSTWNGAVDLYKDSIISKVDRKAISDKNFHVVIDCGNGAGAVVAPDMLRELGCRVTELNCELDGLFRGRPSEPIPENLGELMKLVRETGADLGIAQDGDADRAIFVDEKGNFVFGDQSFSLLAKYVVEMNRGGIVVTPVSTSSSLEEVVKAAGGEVVYTKVGSPIVARVMKKVNAVFGGEENGGLIFPEHQYCRDSAMTIAKMLELLAKSGRSLSEMIGDLPRYELIKIKMHCPNDKKEKVLDLIKEKVKDDPSVEKMDDTDGIKIYTRDGWVLVRPSGTEPIFRIFAESKIKERAEELVRVYKDMLNQIIGSL